jgi:hypothetical protein
VVWAEHVVPRDIKQDLLQTGVLLHIHPGVSFLKAEKQAIGNVRRTTHHASFLRHMCQVSSCSRGLVCDKFSLVVARGRGRRRLRDDYHAIRGHAQRALAREFTPVLRAGWHRVTRPFSRIAEWLSVQARDLRDGAPPGDGKEVVAGFDHATVDEAVKVMKAQGVYALGAA